LAFDLKDYLQFLVSGFSTGCIYALIGLGIIVIYSVTRVINMAQGEFLMLGAMLAVVLYRSAGLPPLPAFMLAVLAVSAVGVVIYRLTIVSARRGSEVTQLLITIGTAMAIRGVALTLWGTTPRSLPAFSAGAPLMVGGAALSLQRLWVIGATALALLLLYAFFEHTLLGRALTACSVNRRAAELCGIPAVAMGALAYGVSAALGALAGIVVAPLTLVSYDMGLSLGLKGFVAAVMGGFVSAPLAVLSGITLGVLESVSAGVVSGGFKDALAYLVLFLVLLVRALDLRGRPWRRSQVSA